MIMIKQALNASRVALMNEVKALLDASASVSLQDIVTHCKTKRPDVTPGDIQQAGLDAGIDVARLDAMAIQTALYPPAKLKELRGEK